MQLRSLKKYDDIKHLNIPISLKREMKVRWPDMWRPIDYLYINLRNDLTDMDFNVNGRLPGDFFLFSV